MNLLYLLIKIGTYKLGPSSPDGEINLGSALFLHNFAACVLHLIKGENVIKTHPF